MPPKSKSSRGKSKMVSKPKQEWRVKNPARNWLELPSDLMLSILQRIGANDILENAQKVCTAWREICKDPTLWRVIHIDNIFRDPLDKARLQQMCRHAVNRSQGQLLDLTLIDVCDDELLQYVADRNHEIWREALEKVPVLKELSLSITNISQEHVEAVGRYCPLLEILKVNKRVDHTHNEIAFAVGKNFSRLTHLQLIGNNMTNIGLQAILDGCSHLESLDLRWCIHLDLRGDLGKRCSQQIKHLKLPHHSLSGYIDASYLLGLYNDEVYDSDYDDDDDFDYSDYFDHRD